MYRNGLCQTSGLKATRLLQIGHHVAWHICSRGFASWLQSLKRNMWKRASGMKDKSIVIACTHHVHLVNVCIRWTYMNWAAYISSWEHVGVEVMNVTWSFIFCESDCASFDNNSCQSFFAWCVQHNHAMACTWHCADSKPSACVRTMLLEVGSVKCKHFQSIIFRNWTWLVFAAVPRKESSEYILLIILYQTI